MKENSDLFWALLENYFLSMNVSEGNCEIVPYRPIRQVYEWRFFFSYNAIKIQELSLLVEKSNFNW